MHTNPLQTKQTKKLRIHQPNQNNINTQAATIIQRTYTNMQHQLSIKPITNKTKQTQRKQIK